MSSLNKRLKPYRDIAKELSLQILSEGIRGSGHLELTLQNQAGEKTKMIFAYSASDHRALLNNRALMRRFAKGSAS